MLQLKELFLISIVVGGLLISCSEDIKISKKDPYNQDELFRDYRIYVVSSNIPVNQKYDFSVGDFFIELNKKDLSNVEFYSRWYSDEEKVQVSFNPTSKLYYDFKNKEKILDSNYINGVEFKIIKLNKDQYHKMFQQSSLDSLELVFNNNDGQFFSKMEFDLLNEGDKNLKFENLAKDHQINKEIVGTKNIRWFYLENSSNENLTHTIYLESQIKNTNKNNKEPNNKILSIVYRGDFNGVFNEENKDSLIRNMDEILNDKIIEEI